MQPGPAHLLAFQSHAETEHVNYCWHDYCLTRLVREIHNIGSNRQTANLILDISNIIVGR